MTVDSILVQDTHGELAEEIVKNDIDKQSLSVWFSTLPDTDKKVVNFAANNVRYDSIPNISKSTYLTKLTYNGSSGYQNKIFSAVVAEDSGVFDKNNIPILTYDPSDAVSLEDVPVLDDVVIDIKMYNGTIDVLNYADSRMGYGPLTKGSSSYTVKSTRSFPTTIDTMPNISGKVIYLDGWYTYTQIVFKDIQEGDEIIKGNFYGKEGIIFKADYYGVLHIDSSGKKYIITPVGETKEDGFVEQSSINYEELLFSLPETSSISPQSNSVFLHSQVLITEELKVAILQEILDVSCKGKTGCDFMDWQKLNLKQLAASIMFENGMFEKSQVILESVRKMCRGLEFNLNC